VVALRLACLPIRAEAIHYSGSCASDEVSGEVQGQTGLVCGPRCREGAFDCPTDAPEGTTAQPQCMLQDIDQVAYCGLLCQVDSQCPSGASCRDAGTQAVGICIHPLSFFDWSKAGTRRKLAVGWPARAGQSTKGFQIAKAYSALQSLKRRYGIADGDADVLVVKELLAASTATGAAKGATQLAAPPQAAPSAPSLRTTEGGVLAPWKHDLSQFAGYVRGGVPGLEREVHDTIWQVENINRPGVASALLRGVFMCALLYLGVGCLYKYQNMGSRGIDMIPHIGFWMEYPQLVLDGIQYSMAFLTGLVGQPRSSGFQSVGGVSDRDTFAHFEPTKA